MFLADFKNAFELNKICVGCSSYSSRKVRQTPKGCRKITGLKIIPLFLVNKLIRSYYQNIS